MGFVSTFVSLPFYFILLSCLTSKSAAAGLQWSIFGQITFGLLMGYVFASLAESWQHRFFGHQATWLRSLLWEIPKLGDKLRRAYWLHAVIHHIKTHRRNFVTLFDSTDEKEALHSSLSKPDSEFISYRLYGLTIPLTSYPLFMWLPMLILPTLYRYVGLWAAVSAVPPMFLAPMLSMCVHPLIHRPYPTILKESRGLLHWFFRTSYARTVIRHHWLHHHYPKSNFNLLLVGDFLLGTHLSPSPQDLERMIIDQVPID